MTLRWLLLPLLLLTILGRGVSAAPSAGTTTSELDEGAKPGLVYIAELKGEVSAAQFYFLRRALKDAEREGASAFVIEMDTYGGEVRAAINEMEALLRTSVPTYTYINSKALSAGALVSLATQKIYMAPAGVIGAAAPVTSEGQDLAKTMADKTVSSLSAMARAAAERTGHNPNLADCFIRKEAELKLGDVVVDRPDSLLTMSAQEAARLVDGKPVLAAGIANSLDEMLQKAGLAAEVRRVEPSGFERLASWLTAIAPLLLMGGILGAYVEIKTPGFGIAGISSIICFTLFFSGSYLAGLAGWEVMIVFVIGLALICSELFVHPGTILPGILGVFLLFGSLIWAMIDRYPGQGWLPTNAMLVQPLINLIIALVLVSVAIYFLAWYLPGTTLYRSIVLAEVVPSSGQVRALPPEASVTVGMEGTAHTTLRPSGKASFAGKLVDVVTQGDLIEAGAPLRILAVEGPRVVVTTS